MAFSMQTWGKLFHWRDDTAEGHQAGTRSNSKPNKKGAARRHLRNRAFRDVWPSSSSTAARRSQDFFCSAKPNTIAIDFILSPDVQHIASQNRYPGSSSATTTMASLPTIPHQQDLSLDLGHLTLEERQQAHDVSPRSTTSYESLASDRSQQRPQRPRKPYRRAGSARSLGISKPIPLEEHSYAQAVHDWDLYHHAPPPSPVDSVLAGAPSPSRLRKNSADFLFKSSSSEHPLTHKPDVSDLRRASDEEFSGKRVNAARPSEESGRTQIKRSRLEQPLPQIPRHDGASDDASHRGTVDSGVGSDFGTVARDHYIVHDSPTPIELSKHMDLHDTVQTHVHETIAPAVTHNTIIEKHHKIRHEVITREIHHHHVFHRILPVIDYEVLPARHFVPTRAGTLQEISADVLPPGSNEKAQMAIHHAVSQLLPFSSYSSSTTTSQNQPRRFSARTFDDVTAAFKEYTTPDGVHHTEQWWVHPPTLEDGGRLSGQTAPFHFDDVDVAMQQGADGDNTGHESYHTAAGHLSSMSAQFPLPPSRNPLRKQASSEVQQQQMRAEVLPIRV